LDSKAGGEIFLPLTSIPHPRDVEDGDQIDEGTRKALFNKIQGVAKLCLEILRHGCGRKTTSAALIVGSDENC